MSASSVRNAPVRPGDCVPAVAHKQLRVAAPDPGGKGLLGGLFGKDPLEVITSLAVRDLARDRSVLGVGEVRKLLAGLHQALLGKHGTAAEGEADRTVRNDGQIQVPVRFHAISDGQEGRLTRATAQRQVEVLNAAYSGAHGGADTGVRFRLESFDVTNDADWFQQPEQYERAMKSALRKGGASTLNLYTASVGVKVLGFSTYPQGYREQPLDDGVVIDYRSVPGGEYRNYDRGFTAVHEVGHWLGLFHTFENGCRRPGDGVSDTPYEAEPTQGCPEAKDTCSAPGSDPVHNFMDYAWDTCMQEFTAGQARRIRTSWTAFRAPAGRRT